MDSTKQPLTVLIYRNSKKGKGIKVHFRQKETTFMMFLDICSSSLGIKAKIIFDGHGEEITEIYQLKQDEEYLVSSGEQFNQENIVRTKIQFSQFASNIGNVEYAKFSMSVLGVCTVGKSNLTLRYVKNEIFESYDPTLLDDYTKKTEIDGTMCDIKITDTAGEENYHSLRTSWMKNRDGLIFLYAINSKQTFEQIKTYLELYSSMNQNPNQPTTIALVGNKVDLENERQVQTEEGDFLAKKYNCIFLETSAKTGFNVEELFTTIIKKIFQDREKIVVKPQIIKQSQEKQQKKVKKNFFEQYCNLI